MKTLIDYNKNSRSFYAWVTEALPRLMQLKLEDNRTAFDSLMTKVLAEVKSYLNRQLAISLKNESLPEGKYKVSLS